MALDNIVLAYARKLLGKRACQRTRLSQAVASAGSASLEDFSYRRVSDSSVWHLVRLVPVAAELRVRRTNWRCGTARDLRTHCHITAAILGTMGFEKRTDILGGN